MVIWTVGHGRNLPWLTYQPPYHGKTLPRSNTIKKGDLQNKPKFTSTKQLVAGLSQAFRRLVASVWFLYACEAYQYIYQSRRF